MSGWGKKGKGADDDQKENSYQAGTLERALETQAILEDLKRRQADTERWLKEEYSELRKELAILAEKGGDAVLIDEEIGRIKNMVTAEIVKKNIAHELRGIDHEHLPTLITGLDNNIRALGEKLAGATNPDARAQFEAAIHQAQTEKAKYEAELAESKKATAGGKVTKIETGVPRDILGIVGELLKNYRGEGKGEVYDQAEKIVGKIIPLQEEDLDLRRAVEKNERAFKQYKKAGAQEVLQQLDKLVREAQKLEKKKPDQAIKSYKKILELSPKNILVMLRLAELYRARGQKVKAWEWYREAWIVSNNQDAASALGMAELYLADGHYGEALYYAGKVLELAPYHHEAQVLYKTIKDKELIATKQKSAEEKKRATEAAEAETKITRQAEEIMSEVLGQSAALFEALGFPELARNLPQEVPASCLEEIKEGLRLGLREVVVFPGFDSQPIQKEEYETLGKNLRQGLDVESVGTIKKNEREIRSKPYLCMSILPANLSAKYFYHEIDRETENAHIYKWEEVADMIEKQGLHGITPFEACALLKKSELEKKRIIGAEDIDDLNFPTENTAKGLGGIKIDCLVAKRELPRGVGLVTKRRRSGTEELRNILTADKARFEAMVPTKIISLEE